MSSKGNIHTCIHTFTCARTSTITRTKTTYWLSTRAHASSVQGQPWSGRRQPCCAVTKPNAARGGQPHAPRLDGRRSRMSASAKTARRRGWVQALPRLGWVVLTTGAFAGLFGPVFLYSTALSRVRPWFCSPTSLFKEKSKFFYDYYFLGKCSGGQVFVTPSGEGLRGKCLLPLLGKSSGASGSASC